MADDDVLDIPRAAEEEVLKKGKACFSSLAEVCVMTLLQYLDLCSMEKASYCSKSLHVAGTLVARCVWKHLVATNYSSPFVSLPSVTMGMVEEKAADNDKMDCAMLCGKEGALQCSKCRSVRYCSRMCQEAHWKIHKKVCKELLSRQGQKCKSCAHAAHDLFFANKKREVLIMGGIVPPFFPTVAVTKMIIEQDDTIHFEAGTPMLQTRTSQACVYHQGEVFSISAGADGFAARGSAERLDTLTQARTMIADRFTNHLGMTTAVFLDNKLLVIGGSYQDSESQQWVSSNIVYELKEHASKAGQAKWQAQKERLNVPRTGAAAIVFQGGVFICCGLGEDNSRLRSIEVLDPMSGAWNLLEGKQTAKPRAYASLFNFEGDLYLVGGDDPSQNTTIEKLSKDTQHQQWELLADCGKIRLGCAAALVGSKIFLFGGAGHNTVTFDYFEIISSTWASQDVGGPYFDEAQRQLPRGFSQCKAVLITPPATKAKTWTDLNLIK